MNNDHERLLSEHVGPVDTDDRDAALFERAADLLEEVNDRPDEDDGYAFVSSDEDERGSQGVALDEQSSLPQPEHEQKMALTPKQFDAIKRMIWGSRLGVTKRRPGRLKRELRRKRSR